MQDPLTLLTFVAVILLVGVLLSIFAQRIRVPDVLFLVLFGLYLGSIEYGGEKLFQFPLDLVTAVAILALTMVVFDSTTKIKIKSMDTLAAGTAKVVFTFLFVMLIGVMAAEPPVDPGIRLVDRHPVFEHKGIHALVQPGHVAPVRSHYLIRLWNELDYPRHDCHERARFCQRPDFIARLVDEYPFVLEY